MTASGGDGGDVVEGAAGAAGDCAPLFLLPCHLLATCWSALLASAKAYIDELVSTFVYESPPRPAMRGVMAEGADREGAIHPILVGSMTNEAKSTCTNTAAPMGGRREQILKSVKTSKMGGGNRREPKNKIAASKQYE